MATTTTTLVASVSASVSVGASEMYTEGETDDETLEAMQIAQHAFETPSKVHREISALVAEIRTAFRLRQSTEEITCFNLVWFVCGGSFEALGRGSGSDTNSNRLRALVLRFRIRHGLLDCTPAQAIRFATRAAELSRRYAMAVFRFATLRNF